MENQNEFEQGTEAQKTQEIDPMKMERFLNELRGNQSLLNGIIAGIAAAATGAIAWAVITVVTDYQIGWMAIGVGFLVGIAVRMFGKGVDKTFAVAGAAISLAGCVVGNLLTILIVISRQESIPLLDIISRLTPAIAIDVMKETFHPMDALFYGIAIYAGYQYSLRRVTDEEISNLMK